MVSIYCIEDINNLKYIGSTKQKLNKRLNKHKSDKKMNRYISSKLLDLENSKIYQLESCGESNRKEREQYWIDNTTCVNQLNTLFDRKQYQEENKEHKTEFNKQHYQENKEYRKQIYQYQNSWGGDKRFHNNLLKIDLLLFD